MRVLHFGSYWMGENDIVALMVKDLARCCEATIIDTELYGRAPSPWVRSEGQVNWLKNDKVLALIEQHNPQAVICNAGGMTFTPQVHQLLKDKGIITVGIALSDPDVFAAQGRHYANLFDLYYTNARLSLGQYAQMGVEAKLLPFAASAYYHRPLPEVKKTYDTIIVGHPRKDRLAVVKELDKHFNVGLYGRGWKRLGILPRGKQVNGFEQVKALNSGKTYISFSKTVANHINVKVGLFEAIACGTPVFTEEFAEMSDYFNYGTEIVGFSDIDDLINKLHYYLKFPAKLEQIAFRGRERLLREHTWESRWKMVLGDVEEIKASHKE